MDYTPGRQDITGIAQRIQYISMIYHFLQEQGLYAKEKQFDFPDIISGFYFLNKLLYDVYGILKYPCKPRCKVCEQDIKLCKQQRLLKLKSPNNNKIFSKKDTDKIIGEYSTSIIEFYDRMYNFLHNWQKAAGTSLKKSTKKTKKTQTGGYDDEETYSPYGKVSSMKGYDTPGDYLKKLYNRGDINGIQELLLNNPFPKRKSSEKPPSSKSFRDTTKFRNYLTNILRLGLVTGPTQMHATLKYIFDWVFFPIYQMERTPVIGGMMEAPLDLITLILEESSIMLKPWKYILKFTEKGLYFAGSLVPGYAWVVSYAKIPIQFMSGPFTTIMTRWTELCLLFLNVERKNWTKAWFNLIELVPFIGVMFDSINKQIRLLDLIGPYMVKYSQIINKQAYATRVLTKPFLNNPSLILDPKYSWEKIIRPNKELVPFLKDIPADRILEIIQQILTLIQPIRDYAAARKIMNPKSTKKRLNQFKDMGLHHINKLKDSALDRINNMNTVTNQLDKNTLRDVQNGTPQDVPRHKSKSKIKSKRKK